MQSAGHMPMLRTMRLGPAIKHRLNRLRLAVRSLLRRIMRNVPPGLRLVLGILLMIGGVFGALPILGFWMLPLGFAVAALDVRAMWRKWKRLNGNGR